MWLFPLWHNERTETARVQRGSGAARCLPRIRHVRQTARKRGEKMEISAITGLLGVTRLNNLEEASLTGSLTKKEDTVDSTLFDSFLNTAIDNIKTTNSYLSDWEDEEVKFALGETENSHDLTIAMQKASAALQYTVAVRDKFLEAYRELMQMQI